MQARQRPGIAQIRRFLPEFPARSIVSKDALARSIFFPEIDNTPQRKCIDLAHYRDLFLSFLLAALVNAYCVANSEG